MAKVSFDAYMGWVNITNPNQIPEDARVISATDLLRYEKLGKDAAEKFAEIDTTIDGWKSDTIISDLIADEESETRYSVDGLVKAAVTTGVAKFQAKIDEIPAKVEAQVAPLVAKVIAEDGTVATAAAAAVADKIDGLSLVQKTDPGQPLEDSESPYPMLWKNSFQQAVMALTGANLLKVFKGLELGSESLQVLGAEDDEYLFAIRDKTNRVAENAVLHNGMVPQRTIERWKRAMGFGDSGTNTVYVVKPDGTGDFRSPKEANAAFTPGVGLTCEIIVHPGTYTDTEWVVKEGVTIRGTIRDACRLEGHLPVTSTDAAITATSTLWLRQTARLENLTITMRNGRYPVHSEASGAAPDARHDIVNCWIEHYGNQDVIDYRAANGFPAGNVWNADKAWGYGSSSGIYERFENVTFVSRTEAWYVHDNKDFDRPINHDLIGCRLLTRSVQGMISLQSLGSGQSSRVNIYGSETNAAFIYDTDSPWSTEDPAKQVAQHSQIAVTMDGMAPVGYRTANRGRALKIESASTGAVSTVRVSGTAATAVFGAGTNVDGGGGLKGYAYGYWDISGILVGGSSNVTVNNTLGRRLGNCATTNKTLTVTVDGGAAINIVFSANHTADTNATILAKINAALGSRATASEYNVTAGETYPDFTSRQRYARNDGSVGIPRFGAVKAIGDGSTISIVGTGDPATAMIGVALEPIPPGKWGRILTSGMLYTSQLPGFTGDLNTGTPVYLSDTTPGAYSATGTRQALTGSLSGWAKF